jgi:hypothetical protein
VRFRRGIEVVGGECGAAFVGQSRGEGVWSHGLSLPRPRAQHLRPQRRMATECSPRSVTNPSPNSTKASLNPVLHSQL